MAFPSSNGSVQISLAEAWGDARAAAANVKSRAQQASAASTAGTLTGDQALQLSTFLADAKVQLQRDAAQSQVGDPALNVATEFSGMLTALDAVVAWVVANFPKDASGRLLHQTLTAAGRPVTAPFTAAQTAGLRTALDGLSASIN
jgi:hypothetical protein